SEVVLVLIRKRVELTCRMAPLCRRSKLQAVPGGGREEPIQHRFGDLGRCRGTILSGIKRLLKEILQAPGRDHHQELRLHIPGVFEAMHDSTREVNKVPRRCMQCFAADLNGQCPLLYIERLFLAPVNVWRWTSTRRDQYLGHEKGATSFLAG